MSVKRYTPYEYTGHGVLAVEEMPHGKYVLATDYDALLAVLRRCVEAMETAKAVYVYPQSMDAALSAARAVLEETP